jgi:hypothetical protein
MENLDLSTFPNLFPYLLPALIIGIYLIVKFKENDFARFAGIITLKPLIATPLWLLIFNWVDYNFGIGELSFPILLTALPGVGITLIIIIFFRSLFKSPYNNQVLVLLGGDTLRWGSTFFIYSRSYTMNTLGVGIIATFMALALPTIVALTAYGLCRVAIKQNNSQTE